MPEGGGRRDFLSAVVLGGLTPFAGPVEGKGRSTFADVDDLDLEPAERADLERFAQPVLQEAAWLEELPLDDVDPAFVFVPRG